MWGYIRGYHRPIQDTRYEGRCGLDHYLRQNYEHSDGSPSEASGHADCGGSPSVCPHGEHDFSRRRASRPKEIRMCLPQYVYLGYRPFLCKGVLHLRDVKNPDPWRFETKCTHYVTRRKRRLAKPCLDKPPTPLLAQGLRKKEKEDARKKKWRDFWRRARDRDSSSAFFSFLSLPFFLSLYT